MEGSDGSTTYWTWHEGEYYTQDDQGVWWSWSDTKPWMEIEECYAIDQEAAKEIRRTRGRDLKSPATPPTPAVFICGDKSHDYRQCPKRNTSATGHRGKGSSSSYMVTTVVDDEDKDEEELIPEADETSGSNLLYYTEIRHCDDEPAADDVLKLEAALDYFRAAVSRVWHCG